MKKLGIILCFLSCLLSEANSQATGISATIPHDGSLASGSYQIYRSSAIDNITLNNLRRPLILVEGFDPNSIFDIPEVYDILDFGSPFSIADQLHNAGFDIIILDFDNGGDLIQRNAFLLVELINQVNLNKPNCEPLVVVGFSMGGLVARYALTFMEENDMEHETRLFVSFDSPHKGAHVPVGIQALALTFDAQIFQTLFPDLAASLNQFTAPAAGQMLKYRLNSATETANRVYSWSRYRLG